MCENQEDTVNDSCLKKEEIMDGINRGVKIRYQKQLIYNKLLPYVDELDSDSQALFAEIKGNLGRAIMLRELQPGCVIWVTRLYEYMKIYGLKFSKEDHVLLIKLMYELVTISDLIPYVLSRSCLTLISLLKKRELISPEDLQLPWEPLYKLACHIQSSTQAPLGMYRYSACLTNTLNILVHAVTPYFPLSTTQEILDELRPGLYPLDRATMFMKMELLECFLPLQLSPKYHSIGYELWFNEFMSLWEVCNNTPKWENEMMNLMARLAFYNIGYINWEPHIPLMFTRFVRSLGLPVAYNKQRTSNCRKLDAMAVWIVSVLGHGSSAQMYFEKFLKTIDTYIHPANSGQWLARLKDLLMKLSFHFIRRLRRERYPKPTWETPVPDEYKLTDSDVDAFVKSMMPVAMTAMFSKLGFSNVSEILYHLATMRPSLVIHDVLERVSPVLGSLTTESYKLYTSLSYLEAIAGPMVEGSRNVNKGYTYPEGPTHVLPLLFLLLPGIDPSDTEKSCIIFHLIAVYVAYIPITDAPDPSTAMDEEETSIYEITSKFEDFVLQFFDRVFYFIDATSLESVRLESTADNSKSNVEVVIHTVLHEVCSIVLTQTNQKIFECALHKLRAFVTEHILETKVAGQLAALICKLFAHVNGEATLRSLVPLLSETILKITDESNDITKEENLDNRLLYALLLLSALVDTCGKYLLPHMDQLITVLDRVLVLKSREGNNLTFTLLGSIMYSLSQVLPHRFETTEVIHWGKRLDINSLKIEWYIPGEEEMTVLKQIFYKYLLPEISKLQKYCEDWKTLSRDELLSSLNIVYSILQGCESVLPLWEEEPLILMKSSLKSVPFKPTIGVYQVLVMPDGSNVRRFIADLMNKFQKVILKHVEDDTKSLQVLVEIWNRLLLGEIHHIEDSDIRRRHFKIAKKLFKNRLVGNKGLLKTFVLQCAEIQHDTRVRSQGFNLTQTHKEIMLQLFTLSTSRYADVRQQAQYHLFRALRYFSYSYTFIVPELIDILKKDAEEYHDAHKGALYILFSSSEESVIMKCDWKTIRSLWPALVLSKISEKLSVVRLKDILVHAVNKRFHTFAISHEIPETCLTTASKLWTTEPRPKSSLPTENEIEQGLESFKEVGKNNLADYTGLIDELLNALLEKNLHWRHRLMAMYFIRNLVHPEKIYPPKVVRYFMGALIHDSLQERQIATRVAAYILKQLKRKHPKVLIDSPALPEISESQDSQDRYKKLVPGLRPDNGWLQYNYETRPLTAEQWDEPRFVHNTYTGYYTWPKKIEIYAPSSEQPCLDSNVRELTEHEKEVDHFFNDPQNIEKLITFFSIEEKVDKFNSLRFLVFKGVFRNHGIVYLKQFLPHLYKLVEDKQKGSQRCASEIIAGIIRGSKHWPFHMVSEMWENLLPIIRIAISNITVESQVDWGLCFANAQRHRDPNRHHWLLECLMEESHLGDSEASFVECGRLLILQAALDEQSWRVSQLLQRLLERTEDRLLASPFENVRGRLGSVLMSVFNVSFRFPNSSSNQWTPKVEDLINKILPRLQTLVTENALVSSKEEHSLSAQVASVNFNDSSTDSEKDAKDREIAIRLFKTVCKWISITVLRSPSGIEPEFYKIFPIICQLENCDTDEELAKLCMHTLALLAQGLTLPRDMPLVLDKVVSMSKHASWSTRSTCLQFLQVLLFHNISTLLSNTAWVSCVKDTVISLLEDERLEVRKSAGQCLSGLLHCTFIPNQEKLLEEFKKKAKTKLYKKDNLSQQKETARKELKSDAIRIRHGAVLGLCSFIQAHPYDIPDYVPSIFEFLSPFMNDPQPIPTTIRKTLDDFKRTHYDGWRGINGYSQHFTQEQLTILQDLTIPPPHYS